MRVNTGIAVIARAMPKNSVNVSLRRPVTGKRG